MVETTAPESTAPKYLVSVGTVSDTISLHKRPYSGPVVAAAIAGYAYGLLSETAQFEKSETVQGLASANWSEATDISDEDETRFEAGGYWVSVRPA